MTPDDVPPRKSHFFGKDLSKLPSQPPILTVVVPCYNEQEVLPVTAPLFLEKLQAMASRGLISRLLIFRKRP